VLVGWLAATIGLELRRTYIFPVVTTTSIILSFSKHWITQFYLENGRLNGERLDQFEFEDCWFILFIYYEIRTRGTI